MFRQPGVVARILYYPPQAVADELSMGIAEHTDVEFFTFLLQGSGVTALHVLSKVSRADKLINSLRAANPTCLRRTASGSRRPPYPVPLFSTSPVSPLYTDYIACASGANLTPPCRSLLPLDERPLRQHLPPRRQHHRPRPLLRPGLLRPLLRHSHQRPSQLRSCRRKTQVSADPLGRREFPPTAVHAGPLR